MNRRERTVLSIMKTAACCEEPVLLPGATVRSKTELLLLFFQKKSCSQLGKGQYKRQATGGWFSSKQNSQPLEGLSVFKVKRQ